MASLIQSEYQGIAVGFTEAGWFNATAAAERFGKRPVDWLALDSTQEYADRKKTLEQHALDWRADRRIANPTLQPPRHAGSFPKRKGPAPAATGAGLQNQSDAGVIVAENARIGGAP
jgi:hypothetical protein